MELRVRVEIVADLGSWITQRMALACRGDGHGAIL